MINQKETLMRNILKNFVFFSLSIIQEKNLIILKFRLILRFILIRRLFILTIL